MEDIPICEYQSLGGCTVVQPYIMMYHFQINYKFDNIISG